MTETALAPSAASRPAPPPPLAMLAELTHRCPLACPYCSNPLELTRKAAELDTTQWTEIFAQAAELGVLQLHLSGGEPLSRRDLEPLVRAARAVDLYVNLITSGIGLTERRLDALEAAGLDHVQLSLQGVDADSADEIGGYRGGFVRKMQAARWLAARGIPLTLNAVMHRRNLDRLEATIALAVEMGARRLEVATVQFHGWASLNRAALMPTRAQSERAAAVVREARARLKGVLAIDYVPADHHADFPKACMGGWGSTGLNVTPDGTVLPCHAAQTLPGLRFERAPATPLGRIWCDSPAFQAYRGTDWMQAPCRTCERKTKDFGGCRCQAMAMTGDPAATDPVCIRSPHREALTARAERDAGGTAALVYREGCG
ncbi:pyrroloquinoline quinone biosynthesis protein PqqE [Albimonas pacifica]|uniref:PqqA peptide cyclase n=1 Tax=Albimonas pacifica TaxID=1114924 RepID=A0A1I3EC18_9RHOB|nr:pyrroloquinoline quinone biosynthesis protein PqqE [Albimonas pacifica]SFH96429.1 pyrroloquinoline quinone biosynthesis protein E [Albimonas pacifica]